MITKQRELDILTEQRERIKKEIELRQNYISELNNSIRELEHELCSVNHTNPNELMFMGYTKNKNGKFIPQMRCRSCGWTGGAGNALNGWDMSATPKSNRYHY